MIYQFEYGLSLLRKRVSIFTVWLLIRLFFESSGATSLKIQKGAKGSFSRLRSASGDLNRLAHPRKLPFTPSEIVNSQKIGGTPVKYITRKLY